MASSLAGGSARGAGGVTLLNASYDVTRELYRATAYVQFLFSDEAQEIAARHALRPTARAKTASRFPALELVPVSQLGGCAALQKKHFSDGGLFDQIYGASR